MQDRSLPRKDRQEWLNTNAFFCPAEYHPAQRFFQKFGITQETCCNRLQENGLQLSNRSGFEKYSRETARNPLNAGLFGQLDIKPGTGKIPPAKGGSPGATEDVHSLFDRQTGKHPQPDQLYHLGIFDFEFSQCVVQFEQLLGCETRRLISENQST